MATLNFKKLEKKNFKEKAETHDQDGEEVKNILTVVYAEKRILDLQNLE